MNDKQFQCFIQAATYLNFHRAAEMLYISQPAMTYQIKSLEAELGFVLFDRDGRSVRLTRAGKVLYDELIPLSAALEKALGRARAAADGEDGFTVAWPPALCDRQTMTALIEQFCAAYPEERVSVLVSEKESSLKLLEENSVVITLDKDVARYDKYDYLPLYHASRACLVSQSHPLAKSRFVTWDMLKSQTLLLTPLDYYPSSYAGLIEEAQGFIPTGSIVYLENVDAIDMNIAAGRGVGIRPIRDEGLCRPADGMVAIPFRPRESFNVSIAFLRSDPRGGVRQFAKFAQKFFGAEDGRYAPGP